MSRVKGISFEDAYVRWCCINSEFIGLTFIICPFVPCAQEGAVFEFYHGFLLRSLFSRFHDSRRERDSNEQKVLVIWYQNCAIYLLLYYLVISERKYILSRFTTYQAEKDGYNLRGGWWSNSFSPLLPFHRTILLIKEDREETIHKERAVEGKVASEKERIKRSHAARG